MLTFHKAVPVCALIALGACDETTPMALIAPISAAGFASQATTGSDLDDYVVRDAMRITGINGELDLTRDDSIQITGVTSVSDIGVVIDGETYVLERSNSNPSFASFEDGDDIVIVSTLIGGEANAIALEVFSVIEGRLNAGNLIVGFDTDPTFVANSTDLAQYQGAVEFTLRNGFNDAFGSGNFMLDVNFADETVDGAAQLFDDNNPNSEFDFDPATILLETSTIAGNGFAGNISLLIGDIGGTLTEGGYEGRFFGPETDTIGGQFFGRIDVEGSETDTLLEGVFLGPQVDAND